MTKHGGKRDGAGRKPKADEAKLIERLSPLDDKGFKALEDGLKDGQSWAVKLFMEYRYGKPKQQIEQTNINYSPELDQEELRKFKEDFFKNY